ncbi:dihydrofolate reductase [Agrilutibacter solisilvae]|uniref:Dihydrofolate reductase n=1 Tax=Agrilutibacter solisilvae TaxID=2763317 RepID=A0A974XZ63_9GAMM|nr:dihydrofolate reductase [Lysobacter solisilvae]QSX78462.1 dihydrofolate reductase [Lysobacter solisilvae]
MRISLIAALDRRFAIGRGNQLPWHLPDDLKRFKALTLGKPVLMGAKTALSLGRALPQRRNLVLTRSGTAPFEGMEAVASLDEALDLARQQEALELCVIGGGEVYALCLPVAQRMHLTHVDTDVDGADVFFPRFEAAQWTQMARESHVRDARHKHAFEFVDYSRVDVASDVAD